MAALNNNDDINRGLQNGNRNDWPWKDGNEYGI